MTGLSEQKTHIVSKCPACGSKYRLRVAAAGRQARCKSCGAVFVVPNAPSSLEDSVLSWLAPPSRDADDDAQPDLQANEAKAQAQPAPVPDVAQPQAPVKPPAAKPSVPAAATKPTQPRHRQSRIPRVYD